MTRYDLALVATSRSMRVSPQGVRSLVTAMSAHGQVRAIEMTRAEEWEEVHGAPGELAHTVFYAGERMDDLPLFEEFGLRFGATPLELGYGIDEPVFFFLEFRGARFNFVTQEFLERMDSILHAHPEVVSQVHTGVRPRDVDGEPASPEKKKQRPDPGRAGTRVEELD